MKLLTGILSFIKTHIVSSVIVGVVIVGAVATPIIININKEKLDILDTLQFEINSEVKMLSLVKNNDKIEIINGDELIDTSKLGQKEVTIKYYDKEEKEVSLTITIVDTTKPTIECEEVINIKVGVEPDLLENVTVSDNSNEVIVPTIEGEYDYSKIGEYNLKYIATDISGNETTKDFILKVNPIEIKTTGFYVYKKSGTWHEMKFNKDYTVAYLPWFCPGMGCGGYEMGGTYKVDNNSIIATFTYEINEMGEKSKLKKPETWEFSIINENKLEMDNQIFIWQKTFEG